MWRPAAAVLLIVALASPVLGAQDDPVFDVDALTSTPLNARTLKVGTKGGVITEEVMFHSETDGEKSVEIFAYFSYPEGAKKLPAFIWNQGGLGKASSYWTEFGAKRGYAALCIDFPMPGYRSTGGYPIVSGLALPEDPHDAPIYHGAVALLKAVSFLQSRPEVDPDRIGMCGSSWGGFYTTLMAGVDPRIRAASAMFGCGALQEGNAWWFGGGRQPPEALRERWARTLDPAWRLAHRKVPIAWFTGTNDHFYWMPAVMESHRTAAGPKHLSLLPNWNHGLDAALDEQVFAWLDAHLKEGRGWGEGPTWSEPWREGEETWTAAEFGGLSAATGRKDLTDHVELMLSYGDAGNWESRCWIAQVVSAENLREGRALIRLPESPIPYYVGCTLVGAQGFRYSTPLKRIDPRRHGLQSAGAKLANYDGCGEWGEFEPQHVSFLQRHAYMQPRADADAHSGKQAARLKAGKTRLGPLLFTVGVPHRFSCWLKAERPTKVKVVLAGAFDGQNLAVEGELTAGDEWRELAIDLNPPEAMVATMRPQVHVPDGAADVLIDSVSLRPVE